MVTTATYEACPSHCYHFTGLSLLSYPAQREKKCCHCGHTFFERDVISTIPPGHGPYVPKPGGY